MYLICLSPAVTLLRAVDETKRNQPTNHAQTAQLDAGSMERILLVSRDEQSCLVVSYKDLKRCADTAFNELRRKR